MPLKIYLAAMGAASLQGSIGWWVMKHRAHHRYEKKTRLYEANLVLTRGKVY